MVFVVKKQKMQTVATAILVMVLPFFYSYLLGNEVWVYKADELESGYPQPISSFELPADLQHIDAAFNFRKNRKTYLFSGEQFWR